MKLRKLSIFCQKRFDNDKVYRLVVCRNWENQLISNLQMEINKRNDESNYEAQMPRNKKFDCQQRLNFGLRCLEGI